MKKNTFDRLTDSYEKFHLQESALKMGKDTIVVSPKLKLILAWSLFILCVLLSYICVGLPFAKTKQLSQEDKNAVLDKDVDIDEEHDTIVPYEKDANQELNDFIYQYYNALAVCDNQALQGMVVDPTPYRSDDALKRKAQFITAYNGITVYTKDGLEEGSYVAFVVSNVLINGVNSSPYDISMLYIVNGATGYRINNGTLSNDVSDYVDKVKGDKDIQKIFKAIEDKNEAMKKKDKSLSDFYEIISHPATENNAGAMQSVSQNDESVEE